MLSNEAFRTHSVFKLENLSALEFFLSIVVTVANYWIFVILLWLTCLRDFCEIFIFTTLKIVERVIWTLEIIGFEQINEVKEKNGRLVSSHSVGVQSDLWFHNPVPTIKFKDETVSLIEKESQTSPFSQNSKYSQDFTSSQHQYLTSPQQSYSGRYTLNVAEEVEKLQSGTITDLETSLVNPQHTCQCPVCKIHSTPCSAIKCKGSTVPYIEKESQTSPQSSVCNQDFTSSQNHDFASSQNHDFASSQNHDFASTHQSSIQVHDLNVVEDVEKLAKAIITANDLKTFTTNPQPISQSPVCTIHLTPCSTNLRDKYSKVLVDSMSPEEYSYLKRKWYNLKKSKKRPYLKMEPIFPSNTDDSSDERRPKKARMMNIELLNCDNDKQYEREVESPEMKGCYKNLFLKLKSKFTQHKDTRVSYKIF